MSPAQVDQCRQAVRAGTPLRVRTFAMLDQTEEALKQILNLVLEHYERSDLIHAVYTAVKELAINAVKANMKRVVFQRRGLDIDEPADVQKGLVFLKERLQQGALVPFALEAREFGLVVLLDFFFEENACVIEIRNNTLLSVDENQRLRSKLARSMTYEDIAQFYMDNADPTEGEGLGMTMITVMLRQNQIDPHCFTIFTEGRETVARLELPLKPGYVPRRRRFDQLPDVSLDGHV